MNDVPAFHPEPACAIVLAGGASSRLGFDKRSLLVDGLPIVEHLCAVLRPAFSQLVVAVESAERGAGLDAEIVVDRERGAGPMMAMAGCLARSRFDLGFVIACDVPRPPLHVARALIAAAEGREGAIPVTARGFLEPLFAVYSRRLLPQMERLLAAGEHSMKPLFAERDFARVGLARFGLDVIPNINTPEDLERLGPLVRRGA